MRRYENATKETPPAFAPLGPNGAGKTTEIPFLATTTYAQRGLGDVAIIGTAFLVGNVLRKARARPTMVALAVR